jgi:DNA-binding NtrC family response regulator
MDTRILVVDDEKQVRIILSKVLTEMRGFTVEEAETAQEALEKIGTVMFDLALVDFKLPDMDGVQLIAEIVKLRPGILAVSLTGHGSIDTAVEAVKKGASDYLSKPVDLDEMLLRLDRVLKEKKRFASIENMEWCLFSWEKIKEMKDKQLSFGQEMA